MSDLAAGAGVTEITIKVPGIIYFSFWQSPNEKDFCCVLSLLWGGEILLVGRLVKNSAVLNLIFPLMEHLNNRVLVTVLL